MNKKALTGAAQPKTDWLRRIKRFALGYFPHSKKKKKVQDSKEVIGWLTVFTFLISTGRRELANSFCFWSVIFAASTVATSSPWRMYDSSEDPGDNFGILEGG